MPLVWVISWCRVGGAHGSVWSILVAPGTSARASAKPGMKLLTGASRWNSPFSTSIISATEVIGLVIE